MAADQTFPLSGVLMEKMQVREVKLKARYYSDTSTPKRVHYLKQSAPEAFAMLRALYEEKTETGAAFWGYLDTYGSPWHGITDKQTPLAAIQSGAFTSATERFQAAQKASLSRPLSRGPFVASPVGSSFDMGKFLTGNPFCAYRRPLSKLPLVNLRFGLSASCNIEASAISAACVKIARAAWEYKAAGGIVSVSVSFATGYHAPRGDIHGFIWEVDIPLQNLGLFASTLSTEFFRALYIPVGQALSGKRNDSLKVLTFEDGIQTLSGLASDLQVLETLKVKG